MMNIVYKTGIEHIDWDKLTDLYDELDLVIGLGRARNTERIKASFKNSYKIVTARIDDELVGSARLISDGYCYGWIHDVGVSEKHRFKGVGKGLIDELTNNKEPLLYGLTSSFMAEDFYKKIGFKKHKTAMAKYQGPSTYLED